MSRTTAQYWVAVSAFETDGWTSQVLKDSNNLFSIEAWPGSNLPALSYGEGQIIFGSYAKAVDGLYKYVIKAIGYPLDFTTLANLTYFMKSKSFYQSDANTYYSGVADWYNQLFSNG